MANAVVYYNEHFGQEPQPLNASIISKEAVVAIVKEILRQAGMGQEKAKEQAITASLVEGPVAPVIPSTAQEAVSYTHLGAIADNKYLLLQSGMRLEVEEMQDTVYSCLLYTSRCV